MHEVIIQGISYDNCTLDTLNSCLLGLHKKVINNIVEKAISYYEVYAPEKTKSYGI